MMTLDVTCYKNGFVGNGDGYNDSAYVSSSNFNV